MIRLRASFDFLFRKLHVFFYRLHIYSIQENSNTIRRFFIFVFYRIQWNWNEILRGFARYLSRSIGNVLSIEEVFLIIQSALYGGIVLLGITYRKLLWNGIIPIIYRITYPIRFVGNILTRIFQPQRRV